MKKHLLLAVFLTFSVACASVPERLDEQGAVAAAKQLVVASKPWAEQATYTAQRSAGQWLVVVSCNSCVNADGSAVSAEVIVTVDRSGNARFLLGLGQ